MSSKYVVLTGGVGGAKLVDGLYHLLARNSLTAIVNTGDDFRHFGLAISPDIDTLLYTLSGKANAAQGWGRDGESWSFMAALRELDGPDWFNLGDGDLALHVLRSDALARGKRLSAITDQFRKAWGLDLSILPMSDETVATWLDTDEGALPFQRYFVERQCRPVVRAVRFEGASDAMAAPGVLAAIHAAEKIFIAPSNPWLSVDPILAVPAIKQALIDTKVPVIAVSPLIGGSAVKGPTSKMMAEMGLSLMNQSIAEHYSGVIDALVIHDGDDAPRGLPSLAINTLMQDAADRRRVARAVLDFAP